MTHPPRPALRVVLAILYLASRVCLTKVFHHSTLPDLDRPHLLNAAEKNICWVVCILWKYWNPIYMSEYLEMYIVSNIETETDQALFSLWEQFLLKCMFLMYWYLLYAYNVSYLSHELQSKCQNACALFKCNQIGNICVQFWID